MPPSSSQHHPTCRRILVVEDNDDAGELMVLVLSERGHDVQSARNGEEGVATALSFRPDIVFCDIGLPHMDGYAVARAMRANPNLGDVRLVALTGYGNDEDRLRAHEAGFDQHLTKPVDAKTLLALVER